MKQMALTILLTLTSLTGFAADKAIPAGSYTLDPAHSKVGFEIPHLVISTVEGRFTAFDGSITIDPKFEKSKAQINIDVASIDTGNKDRDDHLRSPDFFDIAKKDGAKMVFVSKKIVGSGDNFKIIGDLTLKGVRKEVTLEVKYLGNVNDAYGNNKVVFTATGKLNRKDFGLTWGKMVEVGPVVGDEVTLNLKIQANKPVAAQK
ncbi:MAG: YceI family protein [Bdellovibrio sp.]